MRQAAARGPAAAPIHREIDDDLPDDSPKPAPRPGVHKLTIATAAAFLLVIIITAVKMLSGPSTTEAKAPAAKPAKTPWFTFVPPDDPNAPRPQPPTSTPRQPPEDFRPNANKSAFSPSAIRQEFEERVPFDPPFKFNTNLSRPVKPVAEFTTTPIVAAPVIVDGTVYFGSREGQLYAIDAESLKFSQLKNLNYPVLRLVVRGSKLIAEPKGLFRQTLIDFDHDVEVPDPEDAEPVGKLVPSAGKSNPQTWRFGDNEQVVAYHGSYYCPREGEVFELTSSTEKTYHSHVPDLARWRIALLSTGPMGYDNNSVYELDEHLCPTRRLIDVNLDPNDSRTYFPESSLAGDGKTLCFVTVHRHSARMQIWSRDGKEKLHESSVLIDQERNYQGQPHRAAGRRLFAVGGGYLYCGTELIWIPAGDADGLRFYMNAPRKALTLEGPKRGRLNVPDERKQLTPPLITGNKLFVGFEGGGVFVFDLAAFSSPNGGEVVP